MKYGFFAALFLGASLFTPALDAVQPLAIGVAAAEDKQAELDKLIAKRDQLEKNAAEALKGLQAGDPQAAILYPATENELNQVRRQIDQLKAEIAAQ